MIKKTASPVLTHVWQPTYGTFRDIDAGISEEELHALILELLREIRAQFLKGEGYIPAPCVYTASIDVTSERPYVQVTFYGGTPPKENQP